MSYEHAISEIVKVVEATGAGIMVIGGLGSFVVFTDRARRTETAPGALTTDCAGTWAVAFCWASRS